MTKHETEEIETMARNFEVLKQDLPVGTKIKAWTRLGSSVRGGGFYGWLEGTITKREARGKFGNNAYYEIDSKREVPVWDITDAQI